MDYRVVAVGSDFLAQEAAETEHTSTQHLGHCWAAGLLTAGPPLGGAVQIGPGRSNAWSWKVGRKKSKGRVQSGNPPAVSINKANPTVPSATPQPFPAHPGAQPSRAMHGTTTASLHVGRQGRRLTTQSVIVSTRESTARQRGPGSASCHLPRASKTFAAPCALTHLRLTYLALALLGLLLGSRLCTPPFSWLFLGFSCLKLPLQPLRNMRASLFFTSSKLADILYGRS